MEPVTVTLRSVETVARLELVGVEGRAFLVYRYAPAGTVEVVDIVVDDRRKGYGRRLVDALGGVVTHTPVGSASAPVTIYAFTRLSNVGARAFYAALGFAERATVPRFYQDTPEPDPAVLVCKEVGRG